MCPPGEANALQFNLGRPFAPSKQTAASGKWMWVGLPQAVLINGRGFYGDCDLIGGLSNNDGVAKHSTTCNVSNSVVAPGMTHPAVTAVASCCARCHAIPSALIDTIYEADMLRQASLPLSLIEADVLQKVLSH